MKSVQGLRAGFLWVGVRIPAGLSLPPLNGLSVPPEGDQGLASSHSPPVFSAGSAAAFATGVALPDAGADVPSAGVPSLSLVSRSCLSFFLSFLVFCLSFNSGLSTGLAGVAVPFVFAGAVSLGVSAPEATTGGCCVFGSCGGGVGATDGPFDLGTAEI